MKYLAFALLMVFVSCAETSNTDKSKMKIDDEIVVLDFIDLIDSANVEGSILIAHKDTFYSNDFEWAETGKLPASTFKIPNSIIALDLGIMKDDSTMFYWDGKPRFMERWNKDMTFREAFHSSCVPCYQEIARKVGVEQMKKYTDDFDYGQLVFDSTTIDQFWLEGPSKISQFEQIDFVKRFNEKQLPISDRTHEIMSNMMIIEQTDEYVLRGKTGWAEGNGINNCWFVGYVVANNETYYFATNIELGEGAEMSKVVALRKEITLKALKIMGVSIEPEN